MTAHTAQGGFPADGHDIALVDVGVIDERGNRCPIALNLINLTLIEISVDNKLVFTAISPRSLGYITFTFPQAFGKSVKIELKSDATNRDAFGNIVEIQGNPDSQSVANKGGKKISGIVEAEIYAPLN